MLLGRPSPFKGEGWDGGGCRKFGKALLHPHLNQKVSDTLAGFKNHSRYPKEKDIQGFLFPHVCFECRKTFRKPHSDVPRVCPQCTGNLTALGRKFAAPKKGDIEQWKKVRYLVEHGFLFQSVYEPSGSGGIRTVAYPRTLKDAEGFVLQYQEQSVTRVP